MSAATAAAAPVATARMSALTTLRFALAGSRTDLLRIVLTGVGSAATTLGLLSVATVLSIRSHPDPHSNVPLSHYTNGLLAQPGLRPGLSVGLLLVTLPVVLFVVQCARIGAVPRERRLAALRMAGATPADVIRVVATESALAAVPGAALGAAVYFVGRLLADAPDPRGYRALPTDVLPTTWLLVVLIAGVPVLVGALSVLLLRRVATSPYGLTRRTRTTRPARWPAVLIIVGALPLAGVGALFQWVVAGRIPGAATLALLAIFAGLVLTVIGLAFGTAGLSHLAGRLLRRVARRPAVLIAAARATADPWLGSRTLTVLFVAVLFGSGAAALNESFDIPQRAQVELSAAVAERLGTTSSFPTDPFYDRAFDLVGLGVRVVMLIAGAALLIGLAERIVGQHRALTATLAAGVPRRTVHLAVLLHTLIVAAPGIVVAAVVGTVAGWSFQPGADAAQPAMRRCITGGQAIPCPPGDPHGVPVPALHVHVDTPVPYGSVGLIVLIAVGAAMAAAALSLLLLRSSTRMNELRTE